MRQLIGFLIVLTGLGGVVNALLSGAYWPHLPLAIAFVAAGVAVVAWPARTMTPARRRHLLDQLGRIRAEVADLRRHGHGTPSERAERTADLFEQEVEVMSQLGWRAAARRAQDDADWLREHLEGRP